MFHHQNTVLRVYHINQFKVMMFYVEQCVFSQRFLCYAIIAKLESAPKSVVITVYLRGNHARDSIKHLSEEDFNLLNEKM